MLAMMVRPNGEVVARKQEKTARAREGGRCTCTALRKASRRISQLYDTALAPSGLKITQRAILAQIRRSEPATMGTLANALVMDAGALAHTLKPLERDGLVAVDVDPKDRRNRLIILTPKGRAKLRQSDTRWTHAQRSFEAAFGHTESAALREALRLLISDDFVARFESAVGGPSR
jgi:DNA-binding MarR family transcriptional regulator